LILVGRRGEVTAAERGVTADAAFAMTSRVKGVTALARRIAVRLADAVSARIVFARYTTGAGFAPTLRPVLPLRRAPAAGAPPAMPPITHLPPQALLADLSVEYLFAEIADALMESLASENAARMRTMDAASRNIDDRLETLLRDQRIAGQEKTTADMLDVVTGAEAVNNR
ncbi:MAG: F0F1 ATP synthase subunit gamma, partial [Rhodovulum sp.]